MENKLKHLEFIQGLIERMSNHSFLLKRWAVTVATAILALTSKESQANTLFISFIPVVMFGLLDGFYLSKERLYRALYEKIRVLNEYEIDFSMDTNEFIGGKNRWINSILSTTVGIFYTSLLIAMFLIIIFIK